MTSTAASGAASPTGATPTGAAPASAAPADAARWRTGAAAPWLWGAASSAAYLGLLYATLPLAAAFPDAVRFALEPVIWGVATAAGVLLLARLVFGSWGVVGLPAVVLALAGLVLAGLLQASLHAWAVARFGVFAWDAVGPTIGLFGLVVASAVAGFGVLVAPRGASLPPLLIAVFSALASGVVVALNMPGVQGGLDPESVLPALLASAGGAYTWGVAVLAVVIAARRELPSSS